MATESSIFLKMLRGFGRVLSCLGLFVGELRFHCRKVSDSTPNVAVLVERRISALSHWRGAELWPFAPWDVQET